MARCCGERAAFPHTPPSILSTEPSFALAPAPGPEEMSAAGAHSCSPCSIYCFQFNVPRSWAGQHGGNMVMLSCGKPAWKKILPSRLGWLPFSSLEVKPTREAQDGPVGLVLAEGQVLRQYPCVPWKLSLWQPWHGMAGPGDGCKVIDGDGQKMAPQSLPKRDGSGLALQSHRLAVGEDGRAPAASQHGVTLGWGVQPNVFQRISDEWPGRVIHIKPIKSLLAS